MRKRIINRFRLEKKDPNAAVSEPVKPIVFYIDPATPAKWVPYVKRGVESWQAAFEAAGFRNAIGARDAPKNDPEWSAEDARYSIVRWVPTQNESAVDSSCDPRSGEILAATSTCIRTSRRSARPGTSCRRAPSTSARSSCRCPTSSTASSSAIQVAHQIGHALGLPHNLKASSTYTLAQVRDPKWVKENGFVASIMDDARFNYVAQPEDDIDPADLIPKIGPYDKFAVTWGYKPVPRRKTPDQEETTLDQWAREQDTKPYLRFSTEGAAASRSGRRTPKPSVTRTPWPPRRSV